MIGDDICLKDQQQQKVANMELDIQISFIERERGIRGEHRNNKWNKY